MFVKHRIKLSDLEPVSSTKPKMSALDVKSNQPTVSQNACTSLLCPVQAYPVPDRYR